MAGDLVPQDGGLIQSVDDLSRMAKMFAGAGLFASAADVCKAGVLIAAGQEMGFGPFAAMTGISLVKGRPSIGANLMATAVKRSGRYNYRVMEHTDQTCRIAFFERWDGGRFEQIGESVFTAADARKAGTQNMDKYPRNMLFARAMSNGVRWYCPDVFSGAPMYTPEELGADVDEEGNLVESIDITPPPTPAPDPTPSRPAKPAPQRPAQAEPSGYISEGQRRRMWAIANEHGWQREDVRDIVAAICGDRAFDDEGEVSTSCIPVSDYDSIISALEQGNEPAAPAYEPAGPDYEGDVLSVTQFAGVSIE
jgi:hypothetical protein